MSIKKYYEELPKKEQSVQSLVILLHGVGSNGQDLISLTPYFANDLPHTAFVSPDAPFAFDMAPAGYPNAYQWFSLQTRDPDAMLRGVENVFPLLESFIDAQLKRFDLGYDRLVLLGFSQGTMTSLYAGPRLKEKIAGIVGYSGALLVNPKEELSKMKKPPVLLIHGEMDDVVPFEAWKHAMETLKAADFDVDGKTSPYLGHSIDMQGIEAAKAFLKTVFS